MSLANDNEPAVPFDWTEALRFADPDELRMVIALASGLHTSIAGPHETIRVHTNIVAATFVPFSPAPRDFDRRTPAASRWENMRRIAEPIATAHGFTMAQIKGRRKDLALVEARQEIMWALRQVDCWSLPVIGRYLDRDHTTIIHGARKHAERIA